ncbi:MAG: agmatinase [bacterium]|nr:agmatinase [bacterium]
MTTRASTAFLASEFPPAPPHTARFHVIPAPLEKTTSYAKGTAHGPAAILAASQQLEAFNGRSCPGTYGIHTAAPILCRGSTHTVLARIARAVTSALHHRAVPALLGGEHTVTLGAVHALRAANIPFGIIQFDAHADLRDAYEGSPYSHACVMRRIVELSVPIVQIGVRAFSREEDSFRRASRIPHFDAAQLVTSALPRRLLPPNFPNLLYITFDVDCFDPSLMPATGTPVPGGLSWYQTRTLLHRAVTGRTLIGFDVVELAPLPGLHAADFTAAQLVYDLMALAAPPD